MYWDDAGALKFDKSSDLITTPFFGDNDITHELVSLAFNNGIGEDCILAGTEELADLYKYNPTGAGTTIYLWAHGNRSRAAIGVGGSQKSPDQVLTFLEDAGLKKGHTGDICIWSCWGGVLDGFCHAFAMRCRTRGYRSLSVWGSRFVTGTMVFKHPLTLGSETLRALAVEGVKPADLDVKGEFRVTKMDDLNLFRPADLVTIKAAEV